MSHAHDPLDVTVFRFRMSNVHNRDMLEYQAELAHMKADAPLAAAFAQAAALYAIVEAINGREPDRG